MSYPLSTDCETRARARAWISKFNEADGRYLSQKKRELAAAVTGPSTEIMSAVNDFWTEISRRMEMRSPRFNGIIGHWGSRFIRSNGEDCEVGDVFPVSDENRYGDASYMKMLKRPSFRYCTEAEPPTTETVPVMVFKKVYCEMIDNYRRRSSECFWERIE